MINETLLTYVTTERARGVSDEAIKAALLSQGWKAEDVAEAVGGVSAMASSTKKLSFAHLFEGRIGRWQYFASSIFLSMAVIVLLLVLSLVIGIASHSSGSTTLFAIFAIYAVAIPLSVSLMVRRAHDLNWSGWSALLFLIPLLNAVLALLFLFKKGSDTPNVYGAPQADRSYVNTLLNR